MFVFQAVEVIEALRASEKRLRGEKMALTRRREHLMAVLVPSTCESYFCPLTTKSPPLIHGIVEDKTLHRQNISNGKTATGRPVSEQRVSAAIQLRLSMTGDGRRDSLKEVAETMTAPNRRDR